MGKRGRPNRALFGNWILSSEDQTRRGQKKRSFSKETSRGGACSERGPFFPERMAARNKADLNGCKKKSGAPGEGGELTSAKGRKKKWLSLIKMFSGKGSPEGETAPGKKKDSNETRPGPKNRRSEALLLKKRRISEKKMFGGAGFFSSSKHLIGGQKKEKRAKG